VNITVLGAGAWGTALAAAAANHHNVMLWARSREQALALQQQGSNAQYLPGVVLPMALAATADHAAALRHSIEGLTIIATPMAGLRHQLAALAMAQDDRAVLWLCKGLEASTDCLGHEIANALRPSASCGVLSGPSFAMEVALGRPTALVVASEDEALCAAAVQAFHGEALRIYTSTDVVGVEVGGAVKNVLAIATGILDGMPQAGLNARAALITRGLTEMTRLGVALGARAETFMGLSGLGDLVLTATGDLSRNRRVGLLLAQGLPLPEVLAQIGHVAEGVHSARTVSERSRALGVDMPIIHAVNEVIAGRLLPIQALWQLMAREARAEQ